MYDKTDIKNFDKDEELTKADLIKLLEDVPDDAKILIDTDFKNEHGKFMGTEVFHIAKITRLTYSTGANIHLNNVIYIHPTTIVTNEE